MSRNHINESLHNFDEKVKFLNITQKHRTLREIALKTFTYKNTDQHTFSSNISETITK